MTSYGGVVEWMRRIGMMVSKDRELQAGQGLVEYGLIISFVVLVGMVGLATFGTALVNYMGQINLPSPP